MNTHAHTHIHTNTHLAVQRLAILGVNYDAAHTA
jgi:hypothetical protein